MPTKASSPSLPEKLRLALPAADGFLASELSSEFRATAQCHDGELIGASHVFRPVHLLHAGAMESREVRPVVLKNLLRLVRGERRPGFLARSAGSRLRTDAGVDGCATKSAWPMR